MSRLLDDLKADFSKRHEIDWVATGDNVRTLLSAGEGCEPCGCEADLAIALNVSVGEVYNWEAGKRRIPVEQMILLSKFFRVPLDDLYIFKDDTEEGAARELFSRYCEARTEICDRHEEVELSVQRAILIKEIEEEECPIQTLFDLVLYLPLIPKDVLNYALANIHGDVYRGNQAHVLEQMKMCYDAIGNLEARESADEKRKYLAKRPNVCDVTRKTRNEAKISQFQDWWSGRKEEAGKLIEQRSVSCDKNATTPLLEYERELYKYTRSHGD